MEFAVYLTTCLVSLDSWDADERDVRFAQFTFILMATKRRCDHVLCTYTKSNTTRIASTCRVLVILLPAEGRRHIRDVLKYLRKPLSCRRSPCGGLVTVLENLGNSEAKNGQNCINGNRPAKPCTRP